MSRRRAAVGGPLALVQTGDLIELDVERGRWSSRSAMSELDERRKAWSPPAPHYARGYGKLYLDHVTQANEGCDFDFLHHGPEYARACDLLISHPNENHASH